MNKTIISWTTATWNPVHGCSKVSEGCRNCYAETLSLKYGFTKKPWTKPNEVENVQLKPHKLNEPKSLKEPSRIFVNSMSDLFHELIPDDYRAKIFKVMRDLPQHVFQILTKRPENAVRWKDWPTNVWMGVSVEDERATSRIRTLEECGAHTLWISFEPLIAPVGEVDLTAYDWAVVGGESGPGHRAMDQGWARAVRDICLRDSVAFFFKQDSGSRTELRPWLVEEDGSHWEWKQFPNELTDPRMLQ
jgi:protein gp37